MARSGANDWRDTKKKKKNCNIQHPRIVSSISVEQTVSHQGAFFCICLGYVVIL